ncbi:MAG: hypothetical protein KIS96_12515 [Bauldia sp.]|nr:hypothetical protein [Bauldia sp.]
MARILRNTPYTIITLIVFNIVILFSAADVWENEIATIRLLSDAQWTLSLGDLMVVGGLIALLAEMLRATYVAAFGNHLVSIIILIVYVIEFIAVADAANSTFFILTVIALVDVLGGVTITIRHASRDITMDGSYMHHGPGPIPPP